jgi:hypothetical protein
VRATKFIILCSIIVGLLAGEASPYVFDSMDVSSKARGMGGAWTASADDATAMFYNPACLVRSDGPSGYATLLQPNSQAFEMLGFFAYGMPIGEDQGFGVSFRTFGVEYEDVDLMDEKTLSLGYAKLLLKDLHSALYMGGGLNIYMLDFGATQTIDLGSDRTYGIDLGVLGILRERTRVGFMLHNMNQPVLGVGGEPLPQWLAVGVSYRPYYGVTTELDIRALRGEDPEVHMGMEFGITEFLDMRFGFQTEPNSLTGGLTLARLPLGRPVDVDYAYSTHSVLPGTHHVALRVWF